MAESKHKLHIDLTGNPDDALKAIEKVQKALDKLKDKDVHVRVHVSQDDVHQVGDLADKTHRAGRAAGEHAKAARAASHAARDHARANEKAAKEAEHLAGATREANTQMRQTGEHAAGLHGVGAGAREARAGIQGMRGELRAVSATGGDGFRELEASAGALTRSMHDVATAVRHVERAVSRIDAGGVMDMAQGADGVYHAAEGARAMAEHMGMARREWADFRSSRAQRGIEGGDWAGPSGRGPGGGGAHFGFATGPLAIEAGDAAEDAGKKADRALPSFSKLARGVTVLGNVAYGVGLTGLVGTLVGTALTAGTAAAGVGAGIGVIAKSGPMMAETRRGMHDFGEQFAHAGARAGAFLPQMTGLRQETTRLAGTLADIGVSHLGESLATTTGLAAQARTMFRSLDPAISPSIQAMGALGGAVMGALGNSTPVISSFANTLTQAAPGLQSVAESVVRGASAIGEATVKVTAASAPMMDTLADMTTSAADFTTGFFGVKSAIAAKTLPSGAKETTQTGANIYGFAAGHATGGAALGALLGGGIGALFGGVGAVPGALIGGSLGGLLGGAAGVGAARAPESSVVRGGTGRMVPTVGGGMIAEFPEAFNPDYHPGQAVPAAGQKVFRPGQDFAWNQPQQEASLANAGQRPGESRSDYETRRRQEGRYGREAPPPPPGFVSVGKPAPGGAGGLAPAGTPGKFGPVGVGQSVGPLPAQLAALQQQYSATGQAAQQYGASTAQGQMQAQAATSGAAPQIRQQMTGAQQVVQQAQTTMPPAAQAAFSSIMPAIQALSPAAAVAPIMQSAVQSVASAAPDMSSAGASAGAAMTSGTAQGASSTIDVINTVIKRIFTKVIEVAMGALDAHSPSRKFYALGYGMGQGAALGAEASAGLPVAAARSMMTGVVTAASAGGARAGQAAGQQLASGVAGQLAGGSLPPSALTGALSNYLPATAGAGATIPPGAGPVDPNTGQPLPPAVAGLMGSRGFNQATAERVVAGQQANRERVAALQEKHHTNQAAALYRAMNPDAPIPGDLKSQADLFRAQAKNRADTETAWAQGRNQVTDSVRAPKPESSDVAAYREYSRQLGQSIPQGTAAGIKDAAGEAQSANDNLHQSLIDGGKRKHQTQSPSKVAAALGQSIPQGIGQGVVAGTGAAMSTIASVADSSGLQAGHVFGLAFGVGFDAMATRVITKAGLQGVTKPQIDNEQASTWLAAAGLAGPAGSGAMISKLPSLTLAASGAASPTVNFHNETVVKLNETEMARVIDERIDAGFGRYLKYYAGASG